MTEPNFRALCAELVELLEDEWYGVTREPSALVNARAALAQPEPQGPSDEDLIELFNENDWNYISPETFIDIARTVLEAWGRPAIEPVPQGATDGEIEEAAKLIHASMRFAVPDNHYTRDWVERGNSLMQDEARRTARAVLARWGRPAIEPVPGVEGKP